MSIVQRQPDLTTARGPDFGQVVNIVSQHKRVPIRLIVNRSRCRASAAQARHLAMYLSHVVLGQSLTRVGTAFGRDRTTVSYACALIEDLRDDPAFDEEVSKLEAMIEASAGVHHG